MLNTSSEITKSIGSSDIVVINNEHVTASSIDIETPGSIFTADYSRMGNDLRIDGENSEVVFIENYFANNDLPDLVAPSGGILRGDIIKTLAGPETAGQYAQLGAQQGIEAIGQVESISGASSVQRTDGTVEQLQVGTKVFQNDLLITENGSTLSVTFLDGTIFTLSESSRMVLSELVYTPEGDNNSALFDLVEGGFVFIAGEVAKTGDMEVKTPVATMGIRGTTVKVNIESRDGNVIVEVSLNTDPDGTIGNFTITSLSGEVIADVTAVETKWIIAPDGNSATEVERSQVEFGNDLILIQQAVNAYEEAQDRVSRGGNFVEPNGANPDNPDDQEQEQEQQNRNDEDPGDQGNLNGSGLETDFAFNNDNPSGSREGVQISQLDPLQNQNDEDTAPLNNNPVQPLNDAGTELQPTNDDDVIEELDIDETVGPLNINTPDSVAAVTEDGSATIGGFGFTAPLGATLDVTITVGSTIRLKPGSGVTIVSGDLEPGTTDEYHSVVIQGTAAQINDALNGATYTATPNDDDGGFIKIVAFNGVEFVEVEVIIPITPTNDDPLIDNAPNIFVDEATSPSDIDENGDLTVTGLLQFSDVDLRDEHSVELTAKGVLSGEGLLPENTDIGSLALGIIDQENNTVEYQFTVPAAGLEALSEGQQIILEYEVTVDDGNGIDPQDLNNDGKVSETFTVTINGTNDAPIVESESASLSVTEILPGSDADNGQTDLSESGTIIFADVDTLDDVHTASVTSRSVSNGQSLLPLGVAGLGVLTLGQINQQTNELDYTFTVSDDDLNFLSVGESITQEFVVTISDANGGFVEETITVTTNGSNDAPSFNDHVAEVEINGNAVGTLTATDINGDSVIFDATVNANTQAGGTITVNSDGSYEYVAPAGFTGVDTFTVSFTDNSDTPLSSQGTISFEVANESAQSNSGQNINVVLNADAVGDDPAGNLSIDLSSFTAPKINLAFGLDASGSVGLGGWNSTITAISNAINALQQSLVDTSVQVDVHIFQFAGSNLSSNILTLDNNNQNGITNAGSNLFSFDLKTDIASLKSQLSAFPFTGGGTPWGAAFSQANAFFESQPDGETNFFYFFTDGDPSGADSIFQVPLAELQSEDSNVQIEAFGIGSGFSTSQLLQVDATPTSVANFSDLEAALNSSGLLPAKLVDFSLTLNVDGNDIGEVANQDSNILIENAGSFDLAFADIENIKNILGEENQFSVSATIDLDGDLTTTSDQVTLNSFETVNIGSNSRNIEGSSDNDLLLGSISDDVINSAGGGDIIISAEGNDRIIIQDASFKSIDAGAGQDTFEILGDDLNLDFTALDTSAVSGIETIEFNGENSELTINEDNVSNFSDEVNTDFFNVGEEAIYISGDGNDTLNLEASSGSGGSWLLDNSRDTVDTDYYNFVSGGEVIATVAVDDAVVVNAAVVA